MLYFLVLIVVVSFLSEIKLEIRYGGNVKLPILHCRLGLFFLPFLKFAQ
uniref:Uncharacterized protein n=1 Tax=Arundo donax TaxID=35708 RepID=A0A0A9CEL6_ARUDO